MPGDYRPWYYAEVSYCEKGMFNYTWGANRIKSKGTVNYRLVCPRFWICKKKIFQIMKIISSTRQNEKTIIVQGLVLQQQQ